VPNAPPSLVRLAAIAAWLTTGSVTSTPTSDQVPEEMKAASGSTKGTPTTALAVSWLAGAITFADANPGSSGLTGPRSVPASTTSGSRWVGTPSSPSRSTAQPPAAMS